MGIDISTQIGDLTEGKQLSIDFLIDHKPNHKQVEGEERRNLRLWKAAAAHIALPF